MYVANLRSWLTYSIIYNSFDETCYNYYKIQNFKILFSRKHNVISYQLFLQLN
jgi:hypothetical protein